MNIDEPIYSEPLYPTEIERILAEAAPAVCEPSYAYLVSMGLGGRLGTRQGWIDAVSVEAVVFGGLRWKRARDLSDQRDAVRAFLVGARNAFGELVDVVAWHPESQRVATLLGEIGAIGISSAVGFRLTPPFIHESIADWLRADRDGIFIVDERRAGRELELLTMAAPDLKSA